MDNSSSVTGSRIPYLYFTRIKYPVAKKRNIINKLINLTMNKARINGSPIYTGHDLMLERGRVNSR